MRGATLTLLLACLCLLTSTYSFRSMPFSRQVLRFSSSLRFNTKAYVNSNDVSIDGTSDGDDNGLTRQIFHKIITISERLRNKEWRESFALRIKRIASAAKNNVSQDVSTIGTKSEVWLPTIAQMLLVSFAIFGVPSAIKWLFHVSGVLSSLCGFVFLSMGLWNLGENITVFLTPINGNQLVTHGIYSLVRHPMYSGLLMLCSGFAIQSADVNKLLVSVALAVLTDKLCNAEEALITDIHGCHAYSDYKSRVKKLLPYIY